MCWVILGCLDTSHRWQPLLSLRGNIYRVSGNYTGAAEENPKGGNSGAPCKADYSGEEWENSPRAPSGIRVVPATAHRAEPQVLLATAAGAPVLYLWPLPPSHPF